jgi:hypothetical protein
MHAHDEILLSRAEGVEQLSDAQLELLSRKPELASALRENRALGELAAAQPPAPSRAAVLAAAYEQSGRATNHVEDKMSLLNRAFGGRPWYFQAAAAMLLIAGLFALATLLPPAQKSYAAQNGFVLQYDLGTVATPDENTDPRDQDARLKEVERVISEAEKAAKEKAKADGVDLKTGINVNVRNANGQLTLIVAVATENQELLDSIKSGLAGIPGMPTPTELPATWFSADGTQPGADGGISLAVEDHFFSFGPGITAEEAERTINEWLDKNKPGHKATVKIERSTGADGEERVEIRMEISDPEHEKKMQEGGHH